MNALWCSVFFCVILQLQLSHCEQQTAQWDSTECTSKCNALSSNITTACSRGCRLYSIFDKLSLVDNSTETYETCKSACNEAYDVKTQELQDACHIGCESSQSAAIHSTSDSDELTSFFDDLMRSSFDKPAVDHPVFKAADDMMNSFMQSAYQTLFMLHSMFPDASEIIEMSDGKHHEFIIIERGNPEINTQHPRDRKLVMNTESEKVKTTLDEVAETNLQTNANRPRSYFGEVSLLRRADDKGETWNTPADKYWESIKSQAQDWWDCFSKKAGLPEMVLLLFWLSTFLLLLFACCIQFYPKPKLSINGDLAFIRDQDGNLPAYIKTYPVPAGAKSPYFSASVKASEEKVPLLD